MDAEGYAVLHYSILYGHLECVQILLDSGVDVNLEGRDKKTPAMVAVLNDQPKCLKKLIDKGANLIARDRNNQNVLHMAIWLEKIECLKLLVSHSDWNILDKSVSRAITFATEHRKLKSLKALIDGGVDITKPDREFYFTRDPVMRATLNNDVECLTLLVRNGAFLHSMQLRNGVKPVTHASFKGYDKCLEILLEAGARMDGLSNGQTPLHLASSAGHVKCLKMLLKKCSGDVNKQDNLGCTPFWYAAFRGNYKCLELLAEAGANYKIRSVKYDSALEMAAEHLHVCQRCLVQVTCACYGLCTQRDQFHRCHVCWRLNKKCECVQQCLRIIVKLAKEDFGTDVDAFTEYIKRSLKKVIQFDRGEALKVLLLEDADLTRLNYPLHYATSHQSISCLKILLSYGRTFCAGQVPLDPNVTHRDGAPALFWAVDAGWHQGVEAIINAGANINFRNTTQSNFAGTALLQCLDSGRSCFVAKILLYHGASATLHPTDTLNLHFMNSRIRLDIARLLMAAGIPKTAIKSALEHPECYEYFFTTADGEKYEEEAPEFISQLTECDTLQETARDAIGSHLMSLHPESNLFCLVPQLPLPTPLREFLLHGVTLDLSSDNADIGNEMTMLLSL